MSESAADVPVRSTPLRSAVKGIWMGMKSTFLVAIMVMLYLAWAGFPEGIIRTIEKQAREQGLELAIGRMYWHLAEGVIASQVEVYLEEEDRHPVLAVGEVIVRLDPRQWLRGRHGFQRVMIRDAKIQFNPLGPLVEVPHLNVIPVLIPSASLLLEDPVVYVEEAYVRAFGIHAMAGGSVKRSLQPRPVPARNWRTMWKEWRQEPPPWFDTLLHDLGTLRMAGESEAMVVFSLDMDHPDMNDISAHWSAVDLRFRGLLFDQLALHFALEGQIAQVPLFLAEADGVRVVAQGRYDRLEDQAEVSLFSDLPPVYWRNLLPDELRQPMERARIHAFGNTRIQATIGPSAIREFGQHIEARIEAEEVDAHGVWMERVQVQLVRERERIHLSDLEAVLGRGEGQGAVSGQVVYDLGQDIYYGDAVASMDPQIVLPIAGYSRIAAEVIQGIQLSGELPSLDVTFSGNVRERPTFNFEGEIRGSNFVYAGSHILSFDSRFLVTNRVMRIDPLRVLRSEGGVTGWYQHDFNDDIIELDVVSEVDPRTLGRLAGGQVEDILRMFRFEGPVEVHVEGRIDYTRHEITDYRARGRARQVGWRLLLADECELEWIAKGNRISMTNMVVDLYGGSMTGHIELSQLGGDAPVAYAARGDVEDVDFARFLRDLRQAESDMQRGRLSGWFDVEGLAEDDWRASVAGSGHVRIDDGQIYQIRLFGGLSDLLRRIYPGLGYATQSDVHSDFVIADRHVSSSDIRIVGNILSLRGWGSYSLDDRLDFIVHVQPLRRGILVDAVRIVTYPVSRLLQFSLDGTLGDPDWRMDPLPRGRPNPR